ncbi:hypothetical protein J1N35_008349 [Gossypium stocksii]|uniref:Uncharacterized protein n=1 Tax=Gossypium stocksii TaxID=47602 RepID=A0A9D3W8X2_9ROSI|nr:hypothetical protein J1N35_008349 [Gossypium stocksii]
MENELVRLRIEKDEEVWQFNGEGEKDTSRLREWGNELDMGWDLSLRANPGRATTVTSVWLKEDDNEDFLGFWKYGQWFGKECGEERRVEFM